MGLADDGENSWPFRRERFVGALESLEADVVGLQEVFDFQLDDILALSEGWIAAGVGREDGRKRGEHASILVKAARLSILESGTFWLSDTPDVPGSVTWSHHHPRICTWAVLAPVGGGPEFVLLNQHWDHESQIARVRSAALVRRKAEDLAQGRPFLLTGDFNAECSNPAMVELSAGLVSALPASDQEGTFHGFTGWAEGSAIDHILASKEWRVASAWVDRWSAQGGWPSDHFAVAADLELP